MRRILLILLFSLPLWAAGPFYVDPTLGNDSNNGTAKVTPWAHAPGMVGCASNCNAQAVAGATFSLKGGETFGNADLGWQPKSGSGVGANLSSYVYDPTWYTSRTVTASVNVEPNVDGVTYAVGYISGYPFIPDWVGTTIVIDGISCTINSESTGQNTWIRGGSLAIGYWATQKWITVGTCGSPLTQAYAVTSSHTGYTYPILDAQAGCVGAPTCTVANSNRILQLGKFITVKGIEIANLYWTGAAVFGTNMAVFFNNSAGATNKTLSQAYVHGWSHNTQASGTADVTCGVLGDTHIPTLDQGSSLLDSTFDGSDTAKDSCSTVFGSPPAILRTKFQYMTNGTIQNGGTEYGFNEISNTVTPFNAPGCIPGSTCPHTNAYEDNGSVGISVHDNYIHTLPPSAVPGIAAVAMIVAPSIGTTAYVYNNRIVDVDNTTPLGVNALPNIVSGNPYPTEASVYSAGGSVVTFNNTVEFGPDSNPSQTAKLCSNYDGSAQTSNALYTLVTSGTPPGTNGSGATSIVFKNNAGATVSIPPNNSLTFLISGDATRYWVTNNVKVDIAAGASSTPLTITPALSKNEANGLTITAKYAAQSCTFYDNYFITNGATTSPVGSNYPGYTGANNISSKQADASTNGAILKSLFIPTSGPTRIAGTDTTNISSPPVTVDFFGILRPGVAVNVGADQTPGTTPFTLSVGGTGLGTETFDTTAHAIQGTCTAGDCPCAGGHGTTVGSAPNRTCTATYITAITETVTYAATSGTLTAITSCPGTINLGAGTCVLTAVATNSGVIANVGLNPTISLTSDTGYCNPVNGCTPTLTATAGNCNTPGCVWECQDVTGGVITDTVTGLPAFCAYGSTVNALCGDGTHPSGAFSIHWKISDFSFNPYQTAQCTVFIPPNVGSQSAVSTIGFGAYIAPGKSWLQF